MGIFKDILFGIFERSDAAKSFHKISTKKPNE